MKTEWAVRRNGFIVCHSNPGRKMRESLHPAGLRPRNCGGRLKNKLKTYSAGSKDNIERQLESFNKLFVFLHLEPAYKNKVWVIIDNGNGEEKIINSLKTQYGEKGWNIDNFSQFSEHDFEKYYPSRFSEEVQGILNMPNGRHKQDQKKLLLEKVKEWIKTNESLAKEEFQTSAQDVIVKLQVIEKNLETP